MPGNTIRHMNEMTGQTDKVVWFWERGGHVRDKKRFDKSKVSPFSPVCPNNNKLGQ